MQSGHEQRRRHRSRSRRSDANPISALRRLMAYRGDLLPGLSSSELSVPRYTLGLRLLILLVAGAASWAILWVAATLAIALINLMSS